MDTSDGHLTSKEQKRRERGTSQNGQEVELRVEELEERIAPKLASTQQHGVRLAAALDALGEPL